MDEDALDAVCACGSQQGVKMLLVGVNSAVGEEPDEVKLTVAFNGALQIVGVTPGTDELWQATMDVDETFSAPRPLAYMVPRSA